MKITLKQVLLYLLAMVLLGTCVTLIQSTNLGMSSWDALHRNFYEGIPLEYKYLTPISAVILMSLAHLIAWKKPTLLMFFPIVISFIIGTVIDIELLVMPNVSELGIFWNGLYLLIATILVGIALNLIVYCRLPLPALDQFCMAIAKRFKLTFGQGKYIGEFLALISAVIVGMYYGSQEHFFYLGFTTIFFVLFLGFVVDLFKNPLFRFLKGITTLEIYADDLIETDINHQNWRKSARAIITKDDKILLLHYKKHDFYTLPGGGLEKWETLEMCLRREILEETGYSIRVNEETAIIKEYFQDSTYESHYFFAKLKNEKIKEHKIKLSEFEKTAGIELKWINKIDAITLLDNHDTSHEYGIQIMQREFLGLINSL
ncbi:NUDIX domain-containing protein [Mycoplasmatota bacterium WC30]